MKQYRIQARPWHGPIWIDPRYLDRFGWPDRTWGYVETVTTTGSNTQPYRAPAQPVDEERIRKIVREEIGKLPIPFDVPDAPPEAS